MKTIKYQDLRDNVKVGDIVILNTSDDPKEYMCKKNVWYVVSVEPELKFREYRKKREFVHVPNYEPTFTVLDKKEYKALPFTAKKRLYTTEQIDEATEIVKEKILEVFKNIPWKYANLISYLINPDGTAIWASWNNNKNNIEDLIYHNLVKREGLEYDGNRGYTLIDIAKLIKEGWFEENW